MNRRSFLRAVLGIGTGVLVAPLGKFCVDDDTDLIKAMNRTAEASKVVARKLAVMTETMLDCGVQAKRLGRGSALLAYGDPVDLTISAKRVRERIAELEAARHA